MRKPKARSRENKSSCSCGSRIRRECIRRDEKTSSTRAVISKIVQRVIPESWRRESSARNAHQLNHVIGASGCEMTHICAVDDVQNARLATTDYELGMGTRALIQKNGCITSPQVGIAAIKSKLVIRSKPVGEGYSAGSPQFQEAVAKSGNAVEDTVAGDYVQIVVGISRLGAPPDIPDRAGRTAMPSAALGVVLNVPTRLRVDLSYPMTHP